MRRINWHIVLVSVVFFSFSGTQDKREAYQHIQNLKEGVLLVRLHTQDALLAKMKYFHRDIAHKKKSREIKEDIRSAYFALSNAYKFSEIRFFYGRDSKKVRDGNYEGIFINSDLEYDSTIKIPDNVPVYVLDVGNIYFPHMSGHQEGIIVMNNQIEPLVRPFPYYVRKRSGMSIIKRTDLDMAVILNDRFELFYKESLKFISESK